MCFFFCESQASIDKAFNNTTRVETDSSEVGGITVRYNFIHLLFSAYNYFRKLRWQVGAVINIDISEVEFILLVNIWF